MHDPVEAGALRGVGKDDRAQAAAVDAPLGIDDPSAERSEDSVVGNRAGLHQPMGEPIEIEGTQALAREALQDAALATGDAPGQANAQQGALIRAGARRA